MVGGTNVTMGGGLKILGMGGTGLHGGGGGQPLDEGYPSHPPIYILVGANLPLTYTKINVDLEFERFFPTPKI